MDQDMKRIDMVILHLQNKQQEIKNSKDLVIDPNNKDEVARKKTMMKKRYIEYQKLMVELNVLMGDG